VPAEALIAGEAKAAAKGKPAAAKALPQTGKPASQPTA